MQLRHLWPTPIAQDMLVLPEDMRSQLIAVLLRKEADREKIRDTSPDFHRFMTSKKFYASTHYNLFAEADDHPERDAILAFQNMAVGLLRSYLKEAYQIPEEETVEVSGRCFGNVQSSGARTFPHYHQASDVVLIHYLDVGHGADAEANVTPRHGNHALLLLDPRGAPNFPWWEKVESIVPRHGLTIIHPAYLWHETNVWRGAGTRVCIVVNFQIIKPGYLELHRPLQISAI